MRPRHHTSSVVSKVARRAALVLPKLKLTLSCSTRPPLLCLRFSSPETTRNFLHYRHSASRLFHARGGSSSFLVSSVCGCFWKRSMGTNKASSTFLTHQGRGVRERGFDLSSGMYSCSCPSCSTSRVCLIPA